MKKYIVVYHIYEHGEKGIEFTDDPVNKIKEIVEEYGSQAICAVAETVNWSIDYIVTVD